LIKHHQSNDDRNIFESHFSEITFVRKSIHNKMSVFNEGCNRWHKYTYEV